MILRKSHRSVSNASSFFITPSRLFLLVCTFSLSCGKNVRWLLKYNWITGNFESKTVGNGKQHVLLAIAYENRNNVDIDIYT